MRPKLLVLALITVFLLALPAAAQVPFGPEGCEFEVWFAQPPSVSKASVPSDDGRLLETTIAELNPVLNDGLAHYFRAECTDVQFDQVSPEAMIADMTDVASMNNLQNVKVWTEKLPGIGIVGRIRATISTGVRTYYFDIRRYVGESSMFDVWAGAEQFPTEGVIMFFKSVQYRAVFINDNR